MGRHHRQAQARGARRARSAGGSPGRRRRRSSSRSQSAIAVVGVADRSAGRSGSRDAAGVRAPRRRAPRAASAALRAQPLDPLRALARAAPAPPSAAATAGGGGAVEKMNGRAVLTRKSTSSARAADVGAVAAERLAERADDDVDLAAQARRRRPSRARPGPSAPVACASSTISRQPWRRASSRQLRERRDVAVHREDAVGDDQRGRGRRPRAGPTRGARCRAWR